jgi:hypothetical protein
MYCNKLDNRLFLADVLRNCTYEMNNVLTKTNTPIHQQNETNFADVFMFITNYIDRTDIAFFTKIALWLPL